MKVGAKFEVRSFTRSRDNTGVLKNLGQSLDIPTLPFLQIFFVRMDAVNVPAKFEVREIIVGGGT